MGMEYSYLLYFQRQNLREVLKSLAAMAKPGKGTSRVAFPDEILTLPWDPLREEEREVPHDQLSVTYMTTLYFPEDEEIIDYVGRRSPDTPGEKDPRGIAIGYIDMTVYNDLSLLERDSQDPRLILLEFAALGSKMSTLFLLSPKIKEAFSGLLRDHGGVLGVLNMEYDGRVFWLQDHPADLEIRDPYMLPKEIDPILFAEASEEDRAEAPGLPRYCSTCGEFYFPGGSHGNSCPRCGGLGEAEAETGNKDLEGTWPVDLEGTQPVDLEGTQPVDLEGTQPAGLEISHSVDLEGTRSVDLEETLPITPEEDQFSSSGETQPSSPGDIQLDEPGRTRPAELGETRPAGLGETRPGEPEGPLIGPVEEWREGDTILGLYQIHKIFTTGGMGLVYRARHLNWGIDLVIKSPRPEALAQAGGSQAFVKEAETWMDLGLHPHIVTCHYVRAIGGLPRVFAEYVDGGSLEDWIADGRLYAGSPQEVLGRILDAAIQFAWGLCHAHEQGLIHRDVKPANVMLTSQGLVKVTDFGLATARPDEAVMVKDSRGRDRRATTAMMTPAYCSPEQAERAVLAAGGVPFGKWPRLTRATDIWSFALSLLEIFTGGLSWPSGTAAPYILEDLMAAGPPETHLPTMPLGLAALLRQCFRENPKDRPKDMLAVARSIQVIYEKEIGRPYHREFPAAAKLRADSLNNKALSLLDLGKQADAEALFDQAVAQDAHHVNAAYNRNLLRWRAGEATGEDLRFVLGQIKKDLPEDAGAASALGWVCLEEGRFREAQTHFEEAVRLGGDSDAQRGLALSQPLADSGGCLQIFSGHDDFVESVMFSPDGRRFISGSRDKTLNLWDVATGNCLRTFKGHQGTVNSVAFSPDGLQVLSGSADKTLKLWDVATGNCLSTFKGHEGSVNSVAFSPDGCRALSGSMDYTLNLWEVATGNCLQSFLWREGSGKSVSLSPDGYYILSGGGRKDKAFKLWDAATGQILRIFEGHNDLVECVVFNPDGKRMVSGSWDKTLMLWEAATGKCLHTFKGHKEPVVSVAFSPDGLQVLSGSWDKTSKLWDVKMGKCLRSFEGHGGHVRCVAISPDGRWALSGSGDRTLRLWDISLKHLQMAPLRYSAGVAGTEAARREKTHSRYLSRAKDALAGGQIQEALSLLQQAREMPGFEKDPESLALKAQAGMRVRTTGFAGGWLKQDFEGHYSDLFSVVFSPDGRFVLSGSEDNTLKLWDAATGDCLHTLWGHKGSVNSVAFSPDGRRILSGSGDRTLKLWDVATGQALGSFGGHRGSIWSVAFSPEGRQALSGSLDKTLKLWEVATGEALRSFAGHRESVNSVAFSPDGHRVISGSRDKTVKLWEAATGKCLWTYEGHEGIVESVAFSPDGRRILSGSRDTTLKLWDMATGKCLGSFEGHRHYVYAVTFSPDGRRALSGSLDKTLKLWDMTTGKCLRTFEGDEEVVRSVAFNLDGRFALSAGRGKSIWLWELDWIYTFPGWADWDEGARLYLEIFLSIHTPKERKLFKKAKPSWTEKDFQGLLQTLGHRGYGWLRDEGVRKKLAELAGERG